MFDHLIAQMRKHAADEYPREACGIVVNDHYHRCSNIASDPEAEFRIDPQETLRLTQSSPLQAVFHSHPGGIPVPSASDMRGQITSRVPWAICVSGPEDRASQPFWFGDQAPQAPIIGRGFRHGVTDCYSLVRDWRRSVGWIVPPDFPRDWEWWNKGQNLYMDLYKQAGFHEVQVPKKGDMCLIQIRGKVCHAGLFVDEGMLLHHLSSRQPYDPTMLSKREPIIRWQPHIVKWLRHETNR